MNSGEFLAENPYARFATRAIDAPVDARRTFIRNTYDQAHWAETLAYKERTIEPSLALIKATRQHIARLLQHIPDHWDHFVLLKFASDEGEGYKMTVGQQLSEMNWHQAEHCEEINETRRIHSR